MVVVMGNETLELAKLSVLERGKLALSTKDPEILTVLASDVEIHVRRCVAINLNAPAYVLAALATDSSVEIRRHVAENQNASADILTALAVETDMYVRRGTAINLSTPKNALTILASDESVRIRWYVAINSSTSNELLWCMLKDPDKNVIDIVVTCLQNRNLSLTDPSWVDPTVLKTIYDVLQTNNALNSVMLIQLLKAKLPLSQGELIELCDLYDKSVRDTIKTGYELTHPLLKQMLSPAPKYIPTLPGAVGQ